MSSFKFEIISKDKKSRARIGKIITPHGVIETPAFTPVGTQASVKSLTPKDLSEIGTQMFFGNTYHLHLRPGEDIVDKFGGLAEFMGWHGPTITDSGGFQVFSLAKKKMSSEVAHNNFLARGAKKTSPTPISKFASSRGENSAGSPRFPGAEDSPTLVKITDNGVTFRSHLDGSIHEFSPEKSIEIQQKIGADIILCFDECPAYPATFEEAERAMNRTHSWAKRCFEYFKKSKNKKNQALYGIVQGSVYKDLRRQSAEFISSIPFDGIAIGGVAVGESKDEMKKAVDASIPYLPDEKPRHLLGVGEIDDIFEIIERGIDTFDCVIPTRLGRTGFVFVPPDTGNIKNRFRIDITKSIFSKDKNPIDRNCDCYVCNNFTRGYINHLFRAKELLGYRLASYHNIYFINNLIEDIRSEIIGGNFLKMKKKWLS